MSQSRRVGEVLQRFEEMVWLKISLYLICLAIPATVAAHNGAVAIAVPVAGIKVDGDLSDWPEGMRRYPIALPEYGVKPKNEKDYQGAFRIGYNEQENALYIAVEVEDESVVIGPAGGTWDTQDGCEVYVDFQHKKEDSPAAQYAVSGKELRVLGSGGRPEDVEVRVKQGGKNRRYEWRIAAGNPNGGQARLHPGMALGVDVAISDRDGDSSFTWVAWGRGRNLFNNPKGCGDVVLVGEGEKTGTLRGQMRWEGLEEKLGRGKVRVWSQKSEDLWVQAETDQQGGYAVELPAGPYGVEAGLGRGEKQVRRVEVARGGEAIVDLAAPLPSGMTVKAGPGTAVKTGSGTQRGVWHTFGAGDGLVGGTVAALCQDQEGNLWFGTWGGGVCRYDGTQFTTFTTEDGLAHNGVSSILEDRKGRMWFGTGGGVSRYDGKEFTTFTIQDGLAGNEVWHMLEDREGRMWFGTGGGVSRYDGKEFTNFTTQDGLAGNWVWSMLEDREGRIWFGTWSGGVCRYDGEKWRSGPAALADLRFTTFTTEDGLAGNEILSMLEDRQGNLWFGTRWFGNGVSRYDGKKFVTFTTQDGLPSNEVGSMLEDQEGNLWFGTERGVSQYNGKGFKTFTTQDGLPSNEVGSMLEDQEGNLWFGTGIGAVGSGMSRYDGKAFRTFTTQDGLVSNNVVSALEDRQGELWFGTWKGVSRYDGKRFTTLAGLEANVRSIVEDRQGNLWFGTYSDRTGVARYDGERVFFFTEIHSLVWSVLEDRQGNLWFGTWDYGVYRYDGKGFANFTIADGLASNTVNSILEDREGRLWFGTTGGVSRYDGKGFANFTTKDGLASNEVNSILEDREGRLWFGTYGSGVSRYDGKGFVNFTTKDGLAGNWVISIAEDQEGTLWFSTYGSGVSRYDGLVFQNLYQSNGLAHDGVQRVLQDRHGDFWIATDGGGITRYRPRRTPPPARITRVVADREYGPIAELRLPSSQQFIFFEFQGKSFKTHRDQMAYVYRLQGYDKEWQWTRETQVRYTDLPLGEYTFEVKAVDRDLTYSETPATVKVTVHLPYTQLTLGGGLILALLGMATASGYALRKRRAQRQTERALLREQQARLQAQEQLNRELEAELQTAHDLQMGLMPRESPRIEGLDLAGRCVPANHVGGDFFQYFPQDGQLRLCLADVTGHAMEAAIPMVMFSGVLHSEMRHQLPLEQLFANLNHTLHVRLDARTFVCFSMAQLELPARTLRLANGGCPYPYHYRAADQQVHELQIDAYPLGVRPDTRYQTIEVALAPGDYVVFCSDGIIEAVNTAGEVFGYERTAEAVRRGCAVGLSAEELLERLFTSVRDFSAGMAPQDDQTVVVVKLGGVGPLRSSAAS